VNKNKLNLLLIYIYGFYVFYFPEVSSFIGISSHLVLIGLFFLLLPIVFVIKKREITKVNKNLLLLLIGIVVSIIYFIIRASVVNEDTRILQNGFIILQIIHVSFLIIFLKKYGKTTDELIKFPLNLALFQSFICIMMVVFPSLKGVALDLYYKGQPENIFISANRIYGISNDYTFFTPAYHGILCTVALIYSIIQKWKYIVYIPFLLINILLNGRIGLVVFFVGALSAMFYLLIKGKSRTKVISYLFLSILSIISLLAIAKSIVPTTYNWIMLGINDTMSFLLDNELNGNYSALLDDMLFFPPNLIFGEGFRVYAGSGSAHGYYGSDIGYVNDMFMGGILYIGILYLSIYWFILKVNTRTIKKEFLLNKTISFSLLLMLLIANFKGESMRSGLIILIVVYIKLVLNSERKPLENHSIENKSGGESIGI